MPQLKRARVETEREESFEQEEQEIITDDDGIHPFSQIAHVPELTTQVFSFLDLFDLLAVACVCRYWRNFIGLHEVYESVFQRETSTAAVNSRLTTLGIDGRLLRVLKTQQKAQKSSKKKLELRSTYLMRLLEHYVNVQTVLVDFRQTKARAQLAGASFASLLFSARTVISNNTQQGSKKHKESLQPLRLLRVLELRSVEWKDPLCPMLCRHCSLPCEDSSTAGSDTNEVTSSRRQKDEVLPLVHLQRLVLENVGNQLNGIFVTRCLFGLMPALRHLELRDCPGISELHFDGESLKHIQSIQLHSMDSLKEVSFSTKLPSCFRHFALSNCPKLNIKHFSHHIKHHHQRIQSLEYLSLSHMSVPEILLGSGSYSLEELLPHLKTFVLQDVRFNNGDETRETRCRISHKTLRTLILTLDDEDGIDSLHISKCPRLKHLMVTAKSDSAQVGLLQLEDIAIHDMLCFQISGAVISMQLKNIVFGRQLRFRLKLPHVEELQLQRCRRLTQSLFDAIVLQSSTLKSISLQGPAPFVEQVVLDKSSGTLKQCDVSSFERLSIFALGPSSPKLKILNLVDVPCLQFVYLDTSARAGDSRLPVLEAALVHTFLARP